MKKEKKINHLTTLQFQYRDINIECIIGLCYAQGLWSNRVCGEACNTLRLMGTSAGLVPPFFAMPQ